MSAPGRSQSSGLVPGQQELRPGDLRIEWLDGVRALAASYVVFHHAWLMSYGGFPGNNGPWAVGWLVYGHLAVAVFIVVSGFSLTLSPARREFRLAEGGAGFLRRRFWRIVPPYWAALALSALLIVAGVIGTPDGSPLHPRDVLVHALLVQDTFANTPPNGVFWSIAIEWHIYFFFPLLLLCFRKFGAVTTAATAGLLIVLLHLSGTVFAPAAAFARFTPQFFALFVFGMLAVAASHGEGRSRAGAWLAAGILSTFLAGCIALGPRAVVRNYFWVDLLVGLATASAFVALSKGQIAPLRRLLASRGLVFVGRYAFSLYLIHPPVLDMVRLYLVRPLGLSGAGAFWMMLLVGGAAALTISYGFFLVFERPFLRIRSWGQLRQALRVRQRAEAT